MEKGTVVEVRFGNARRRGVVTEIGMPPPDGVWGMPPEMLAKLVGYDPDAEKSREQGRALMRKAYGALVPGGLVNVMDMMTDATHTQPPFSALFAVNMALTTQNDGEEVEFDPSVAIAKVVS